MANRLELYGDFQLGGCRVNPDFSERTYTAEVMKTVDDPSIAAKSILRLTCGERNEYVVQEKDSKSVKVIHCFVASKREFHRSLRQIVGAHGEEIAIPRRSMVRGSECYLYDVFIAHSQNHLVIGVPFHELAEQFFPKVDRALAGTNTLYQKLDITSLVVRLGSAVLKSGAAQNPPAVLSISVTRCHLAYADAENRIPSLHQVRMTGSNLGGTEEYRTLIGPVLEPGRGPIIVTPIVLGFGLLANGVKKCSAITDRHGNFKIWVAPGLRRLTRIFSLLSALENMKNVTSTTSNVPILQSKAIETAED
jgi:hypothetical protein